MKVWIAGFFVFFALEGFCELGNSQPGFMIYVQSTYSDRAQNGKPITISGYGFLAKNNDRYFVICDSHLSQGDTTSLRSVSNGRSISWFARIADNDRDIEIFEVKKAEVENLPAFSIDQNALVMSVSLIPSWKNKEGLFRIGKNVYIPVTQSLLKMGKEYQPLANSFLDQGLHGYASDDEMARDRGDLMTNWNGEGWISDSGVVPGMSGAPLLQEIILNNTAMVKILGLATGYHRYFKRSYFSEEKQILNLLSDFESGRSLQKSTTKWQFYNFLYRDFGNGNLEISPLRTLSGSLRRAGGGTGGDSGGGTGGDSGGDSQGQNPFKNLGINWGMKVQGEDTIAFGLFWEKSPPLKIFVFASPEGQSLVQRWKSEGQDFVVNHLLKKDLKLDFLFENRLKQTKVYISDVDPKRYSLDSGDCLIDEELWTKNKKIHIRLPWINRRKSPLYFTLDLSNSIGAELKEFNPYFTIQSKEGLEKVIVDIKGLFFLDATDLNKGHLGYQGLIKPIYVGLQSPETGLVQYSKCYRTKNSQYFLERPGQ